MRYAVANDLASRNPVADVKPADVLKPRRKRNYPRVTPKELPDLLNAIDTYIGSVPTVVTWPGGGQTRVQAAHAPA
jgi:hypothetical protein